MPIKLIYFDIRGRAEICRLVLHAGKKPFTDQRLQQEEWLHVKPSTPFESLPVLEVDGVQLSQGIAIATYLAKECGLYASDNIERLQIDQIQQLREDLFTEELKTYFQEDPVKKAKLTANMRENVYPRFLTYFDKLIRQNRSQNGSDFVVGRTLTLADIVIFEGTQTISQKEPEILDKFPEIMALRKLVEETDGIRQYLATRKLSDL